MCRQTCSRIGGEVKTEHSYGITPVWAVAA